LDQRRASSVGARFIVFVEVEFPLLSLVCIAQNFRVDARVRLE